jgi:hypothetical protein
MTGVLGNEYVHEHGSVVACCFVRIFPFKADVRVSGLKKASITIVVDRRLSKV